MVVRACGTRSGIIPSHVYSTVGRLLMKLIGVYSISVHRPTLAMYVFTPPWDKLLLLYVLQQQ